MCGTTQDLSEMFAGWEGVWGVLERKILIWAGLWGCGHGEHTVSYQPLKKNHPISGSPPRENFREFPELQHP